MTLQEAFRAHVLEILRFRIKVSKNLKGMPLRLYTRQELTVSKDCPQNTLPVAALYTNSWMQFSSPGMWAGLHNLVYPRNTTGVASRDVAQCPPALLDCSFLAYSPEPSHHVWAAQAHMETRHASVPVNNPSWSPSQQPTSTASSRRKPSWVSSSHIVKGQQFQPILNSNHTGS